MVGDGVRVQEVAAQVLRLGVVGHVAEGLELRELLGADRRRVGASVHVETSGLRRGIAEILGLGIVVLQRDGPTRATPRRPCRPWGAGLDLDHPVRPQALLGRLIRAPPGALRLFRRLHLPRDGQHVPVREQLDVVVQHTLRLREPPLPHHVPVPVDLLEDPAGPARAEAELLGIAAGAEQVPVRQEVHPGAGRGGGLPDVDDLAVVVHEVARVG